MAIRMAVALLAVVACVAACTRIITRGEHGFLAIGDSKAEVLAKLRQSGVGHLELVPTNEEIVSDPDAKSLRRFAESPGIIVWSHAEPLPLRIEFPDGTVTSVWPAEITKLEDLRAQLPLGTPRSAVLLLVAEQPRDRRLTVAEHIPNHGPHSLAGLTPEAESYMLAHDHWRFDGLREACAFEPFYSRVSVSFEGDHLSKVEHWCFPFELP
jgi:hypothetical protein